MKTTAPGPTMSLSNRADIYATIGVGIIVAVFTIVTTTLNVIRILPNKDVPVLLPFVDTAVELPIGPGSTGVTVTVETATATASNLPGITLASLVLAEVAIALTVLTVTVLICLLCLNMLRGTMFSRTNSRLVTVSSFAIVVGWGIHALFTTMGVNGTFGTLSDYSYDNVIFTMNWLPFVFAMTLGALALAFRAGERMQRDTDGLV